jgi:hypothetical protein
VFIVFAVSACIALQDSGQRRPVDVVEYYVREEIDQVGLEKDISTKILVNFIEFGVMYPFCTSFHFAAN